jgi:hypothetical protein
MYSAFLLFQACAVVGVDPGVQNLVSTASLDDEGNVENIHEIKNRHYQEISGIFTRRRDSRKRANRVMNQFYSQAMTSLSVKTVDVAVLLRRRAALHVPQTVLTGDSLHDFAWQEALPRSVRNTKFRAWVKRTSTISIMVTSLRVRGKRLVLLYGDGEWTRGDAPNAAFLRECRNQYTVIMVDEWMTSQTCFNCGDRFPKTVDKDYKMKRGILRCGSLLCKSCCFYNRDLVGAVDMFIKGTTPNDLLPDNLRRDKRSERSPTKRDYYVLQV